MLVDHKKVSLDLENHILEVWKSELKMSQIDVNDDFFDIGGHSLSLINILDAFHKDADFVILKTLKIGDLFEYTSIKALCDHLASQPIEVMG